MNNIKLVRTYLKTKAVTKAYKKLKDKPKNKYRALLAGLLGPVPDDIREAMYDTKVNAELTCDYSKQVEYLLSDIWNKYDYVDEETFYPDALEMIEIIHTRETTDDDDGVKYYLYTFSACDIDGKPVGLAKFKVTVTTPLDDPLTGMCLNYDYLPDDTLPELLYALSDTIDLEDDRVHVIGLPGFPHYRKVISSSALLDKVLMDHAIEQVAEAVVNNCNVEYSGNEVPKSEVLKLLKENLSLNIEPEELEAVEVLGAVDSSGNAVKLLYALTYELVDEDDECYELRVNLFNNLDTGSDKVYLPLCKSKYGKLELPTKQAKGDRSDSSSNKSITLSLF